MIWSSFVNQVAFLETLVDRLGSAFWGPFKTPSLGPIQGTMYCNFCDELSPFGATGSSFAVTLSFLGMSWLWGRFDDEFFKFSMIFCCFEVPIFNPF